MKIQSIKARQILDSRGNPTIEVELKSKSAIGNAAVPSGASTGIHEAHELRDGGKAFGGKGVLKAINNVNKKIALKLKGFDVNAQEKLDSTMIKLDGTKNKKKLGANAILGVSMAATRVGAVCHNMPLFEYLASLYNNNKPTLPMPFANVINGGVHAGNGLKIQEFMIVPIKAKSFSEAVRMVSETYHTLREILKESFGPEATNVGDEGGFAPPLNSADEALELLEVAIEHAGYKGKVKIAIDAAASEFYNKKTDTYEIESGRHLTREEMMGYYEALLLKYPLVLIEDPFAEDDFEGFKMFTQQFSKQIQVVGDDLLVTNPDRIAKAIQGKFCNSLLLKINQIGTITEAMKAAHLAQKAGWKIMVSHRSGETEDPYIADLVVGLGVGQIKLGAPCRGERTAKYNQLLRIEAEFGKSIKFNNKFF